MKRSFIYFVTTAAEHARAKINYNLFIRIKIGRTTDIKKRLMNLQVSSPDLLVLIKIIEHRDEKYIHEYFRNYHIRGEWFRINYNMLYGLCRSIY
jgi:hypothetical protein